MVSRIHWLIVSSINAVHNVMYYAHPWLYVASVGFGVLSKNWMEWKSHWDHHKTCRQQQPRYQWHNNTELWRHRANVRFCSIIMFMLRPSTVTGNSNCRILYDLCIVLSICPCFVYHTGAVSPALSHIDILYNAPYQSWRLYQSHSR